MKTLSRLIAITCLLAAGNAYAQNWTTVSAANITDLNQNKLAAGQLCFLGTDQNDNPISFSVGGGGQVLKRAFCSAIANGAVTAFTVPNPTNTSPSGIYYRVTVKDTSSGLEVLRYSQMTFSGGTFSFDNYAPANLGSFAPLTGNAVSGNLSVSGNASITGSLTAGSFNPTVLTSGQFTSNTANPAGAGILRLASGDAIGWRNNANTANIALAKTGAASGGVPADALDTSGFGGLKLASPAISAEGVAPPGVAGSDVLYADSTAHRWKMINNNGASDTVLGAATTDTLSNKTLASPTSTGTDNGSEILQNKTLTGASNGNSVTLLNEQGPIGVLTGNSTDQTVYSYTLPGNVMGPGKGILIRCWLAHIGGSGSVTYKIFFGATAYMINSATDTNQQEYVEAIIFNNSGLTNAQHGSQVRALGTPTTFQTFGGLTSAIDTTSNVVIKVAFNAANTEQVTPEEFIVTLIQ